MTFKFTFRVDPVGMTIPYAAIADDILNNSGFEDLRGHPDKASAIAEGNASPALRRLLVRIANVGSTIFTLGCELGSHQEPTLADWLRALQVSVRDYHLSHAAAVGRALPIETFHAKLIVADDTLAYVGLVDAVLRALSR
jgi:hypothetical protein